MERFVVLAAWVVPLLGRAISVGIAPYPTTCLGNDGMLVAFPNGGTAPYTFSWSNGPTTAMNAGLLAGSYTVTVTDQLGATAQATATVVELDHLRLAQTMDVDLSCNGPCSGRILVDTTLLGGTPPYSFSPLPSYHENENAVFDGACPFVSNLIEVVDAAGCEDGRFVTFIGQPTVLVSAQVNSAACAGQENGSATVTYDGAAGEWYYFVITTITGPGGEIYSDGIDNVEAGSPVSIPLTDLLPGNYTIESQTLVCGPVYQYDYFTIPDLGPDCGSLSGTILGDADGDCNADAGEVYIPYQVLTITPGPQYTITNVAGAFAAGMDYGSYSLAQSAPDLVQLCPVAQPIPFTLSAGSQQAIIAIADSSTLPFDLEIELTVGPLRPGFSTNAWITVHNQSMYASGPVQISLTHDVPPGFGSAQPTPSSALPGIIQWDLGDVPAFGYSTIQVALSTPPDPLLLGTSASFTATANAIGVEADTGNNTTTVSEIFTGSYDPNKKLGITSTGWAPATYYLGTDEWLDYTVRFQNTGTAAAETVVVRDTIDTNLFIPSLEILGASHSFTPAFGEGRELIFTFGNIDLPDSTTDLLASQGFISYRIKPNDDVVAGTLIENTAGIYFDFNPPIVTNTVTHVVDFSTSTRTHDPAAMCLAPNPASDVLNVILPEGSGSAFTVLSIDGRIMDVPSTRKDDNLLLDVRALSPGPYIVRTAQGAGRFVKN